ncbi:MAG: radical SAM protein [Clostridia bacterium]|nr:radical SAM protein [Clostridia bacterium]
MSLTRLWCGAPTAGDLLRYPAAAGGTAAGVAPGQGPVVVWNCTRACNLRCRHCYAEAAPGTAGELTTAEGRRLLEDLAAYRVPVVLFSGGEPLLRPDLFLLVAHAAERGIRPVLSTNGTLITPAVARKLKESGIAYIGISLDGREARHDYLRGCRGAFGQALAGLRHCLAAGLKVGVRFTLTRENYQDLEAILDLIEKENIPRACFYHLVPRGRASRLARALLAPAETRRALEILLRRTEDLWRRGLATEILTVDNHADGVYLYLKLRRLNPERAAQAYALLLRNGGNRSGNALAAVDWEGNVHPDQFTLNHTLGNVRLRPFGQIWSDSSLPLLAALRQRRLRLQGRCRHCRWLEVCNGNLRARAEALTGDFWAADPGCYLTDEEIGLAGPPAAG